MALMVSLQTMIGEGKERGLACLTKLLCTFFPLSPLQSFKCHGTHYVEGPHYASHLYSCLAPVVIDAWQALR